MVAKVATEKHTQRRLLDILYRNVFPNTDVPTASVQLVNELSGGLTAKGILPWGTPTTHVEKAHVRIGEERHSIFSSYSYLGLIDDIRILEAAVAAAKEYGVGSHGVRALTGHLEIHDRLERNIARFMGKEEALVFSSGFLANIGVISGLVMPQDHIFVDEWAHVSLVRGCQLSGATIHQFRHNDYAHARRLYDQMLPDVEPTARFHIVTDSVFSMDGDLLDLPAAHAFKRAVRANLIVDEAHGVGTIGTRGAGIEDHFGMKGAVDIVLGTFSKGIPSAGGFVACSSDVIGYLRYIGASPNLFSSPLSPFHCGAALESLSILESNPHIVAKLNRNGKLLRERLSEAGHNIGGSETVIVPLIFGSEIRTLEIWRRLLDRKYFTAAVTAPAVGLGKARLRLAAHAGHEADEIEAFVRCVNEVCRSVA